MVVVRETFVVLTAVLAAAIVRAQDEAPAVPPDPLKQEQELVQRDLAAGESSVQSTQDGTPVLTMVRAMEPPVIDGRLDEPVWEAAPAIDELTQVEPVEGAVPSQDTTIRLLYDSGHIYIGVRCHDTDPEAIVATQMLRDAQLDPDDRIEMIFDTFHDRRNAYYFQINPVGAKGDALIENSSNFNKEWDGVWFGKASIDDEGWVAEIAIPFKTISFDPNGSSWGFNFARVIRRTNETARWSSPRQDVELFTISEAGVLAAITEIEQGLGLDVRPSLALKFRHDRERDRDVFTWDPGVDIFYKITPSVTGAVTINTDFAETEVDERRVNLTRFPLFFPEKRDFFLQDAGIFSFGGIRRNPIAFHSRRIGIVGGDVVDLLAGVKVTGRVGRVNFGVLDVQMADAGDGIGSKNLAVGRVAVNILEESTVGVIGTFGDPGASTDNGLVGFDFNYRNSNFLGDKVLKANAWFLHSFTEGSNEDEAAIGLKLDYDNDDIQFLLGVEQIGPGFNPALGFVQRTEDREIFNRFRYRWRPTDSWIRTIDTGYFNVFHFDFDNELESARVNIEPISIGTQAGDELGIEYTYLFERLDEPFEISDGIILPVGRYNYHEGEIRLETSAGRPVSVEAEVGYGSFYNGTRFNWMLGITWNASRHFNLSGQYEENRICLDQGDFETRVLRVRADIYFTPDISWNTFAQYDNVSKSLGINSRFRWIIEPGREFFFVVNQGFAVEKWKFRSTVIEFTAKIGWIFRF